jgi:hypothetical protein
MDSKEEVNSNLQFSTKQIESISNEILTANSSFKRNELYSKSPHLVPPIEYQRTNSCFLSSLGLPSISKST